MTCERCEPVPDAIIENYIRNERIKVLKQELAQLEAAGKPTATTRMPKVVREDALEPRWLAEDRRTNTPA